MARPRSPQQREFESNHHAWQQLVRPLDQANLTLPPEFAAISTPEGFNQLAEPATTFCHMPTPLSAHTVTYLDALQPDEFTCGYDFANLKVKSQVRQLPSHFAYRKDLGIYAQGNSHITATQIQQRLRAHLPDRPGRADFIAEMTALVEQVATHVGSLDYFRLLATKPWMPPPQYFAPHEDIIGEHALPRLILLGSLNRPGVLICPTRASEPLCAREIIAGTPSAKHAKLSEIGEIYQLPAWHVGGWRSCSPDFNGLALAHATPPVTGSFRPHFIMQVRPNWLRPA